MASQGRLVAAFLCLLLPAAARADDVSDAIAEASKAYAAGDLGAARTQLGEALQFLAQRAAARLAAALPAALPGWTAQDAESNTSQAAFMGAGIQASRKYEDGQGGAVEIQVVADSPIIAQLSLVLNNPAMAGAMGKLIRVGSQRAVQTNDNEIQMLVDNRILISLTGSANADAKMAYAKAIDTGEIAKIR